jgi:hypothetical protein
MVTSVKKPSAAAVNPSKKPAATATKPAPAATKKGGVKIPERPVIYPEPEAIFRVGENAITAEEMKEILGWTEDVKLAKSKGVLDPTFTRTVSKKKAAKAEGEEGSEGSEGGEEEESKVNVYCLNNTMNRPFKKGVAEQYKQDMLNKRFKLNGEGIIVGKTGQMLSGQHRGIALVLADLEAREGKNAENRWKEIWPNGVTLETLLVTGVDESIETVQTFDTVAPRTFADALYCRPDLFRKLRAPAREELAKMLDRTVRMMWHRGRRDDAFTPRRTHAEGMDYLDRHPKIIDAAKEIYEIGKLDEWRPYFSPGYAAAFFYLMAGSGPKTEWEGYHNANPPHEKGIINFDLWGKAKEFWTHFRDAPAEDPLKELLKSINEKAEGPISGTIEWVEAAIVKAWLVFKEGDTYVNAPGEENSIYPKFGKNKAGYLKLAEMPLIGGIDMGHPSTKLVEEGEGEEGLSNEVEESESEENDPDAPSEEEIAAESERIRMEKESEKDRKAAEKKKADKERQERVKQAIQESKEARQKNGKGKPSLSTRGEDSEEEDENEEVSGVDETASEEEEGEGVDPNDLPEGFESEGDDEEENGEEGDESTPLEAEEDSDDEGTSEEGEVAEEEEPVPAPKVKEKKDKKNSPKKILRGGV